MEKCKLNSIENRGEENRKQRNRKNILTRIDKGSNKVTGDKVTRKSTCLQQGGRLSQIKELLSLACGARAVTK